MVAKNPLAKSKRDTINAILLDNRLSPATRIVGWFIADHVNAKRAYAWPSQQFIRKKLGLSVRHVRRAISDLVKCGYFEVDKNGRNHEYRIATPAKKSGVDTGHFRPKSRTSTTVLPDTACPPSLENTVKSSADLIQKPSKVDDKWHMAKELLEKRVGPDRFHNWLKNLIVVQYGTTSVTLGAATKFIKRQVEEQFPHEIEKAWKAVDPAIAVVSIVVSSEEWTGR
jgi:biotin operon repressor